MSSNSSINKMLLDVEVSPQQAKQIYKNWSNLIKKGLIDYAKMHATSWYGAKFNPKWMPFEVRFNNKEHAFYIWGNPPNENINKHEKKSKRVPWGKTDKKSTNDNYTWQGKHYHRVFIHDSRDSNKGFWYTAKKKWSGTGNTFYSNSSHYTIDIKDGERGYTRGSSKTPRRYPFPAKWNIDHNDALFSYSRMSVSDNVIDAERSHVAKIIWDSFDSAIEKILKI